MKLIIPLTIGLLLNISYSYCADFSHPCEESDTNEITQLACGIYHESRGESELGQYAVAFNILHRVDDYRYPNTVREVVWQSKQYSWTLRKDTYITNYKAYVKALQIASVVYSLDSETLLSESPINGSLWYHSSKIKPPKWVDKQCKVATIGLHIYYDCIKYK